MICNAPKTPVRMHEQVSNVMAAQWLRGSDWAIAHARAFRDEVKQRVDAGIAACPSERLRLMWVGAGLWHDTDFYTAFEEQYGAVFVWSMYLAFGPDGYIRYGLDDPLRALASRTVSFNEQLHNPPWANEWIVDQAKRHRIDAALVLEPLGTRPSATGNRLHRAGARSSGIPVLPIVADMVDARGWNGLAMRQTSWPQLLGTAIVPQKHDFDQRHDHSDRNEIPARGESAGAVAQHSQDLRPHVSEDASAQADHAHYRPEFASSHDIAGQREDLIRRAQAERDHERGGHAEHQKVRDHHREAGGNQDHGEHDHHVPAVEPIAEVTEQKVDEDRDNIAGADQIGALQSRPGERSIFTADGTKNVALKPPMLISPSRTMLQTTGVRNALLVGIDGPCPWN